MSVHMTGECWDDLADKRLRPADEIGFALLDRPEPAPRACDLPAVVIRLDLPDGSVAVAQTSARLFCTAARMFLAKHPELFAMA